MRLVIFKSYSSACDVNVLDNKLPLAKKKSRGIEDGSEIVCVSSFIAWPSMLLHISIDLIILLSFTYP